MPRVKCKGVATLIDKDPNACIQFDSHKKFYVIPLYLADQYVTQSSSVPVLLEHNRKFTVGRVDNFRVEETLVNGEKRDVLEADFTIDNEAFISVLQEVCAFRLQEIAPADYTSTDGFVGAEKLSPKTILDLTAHEALLQRLPGLSLSHDVDNYDIVELSLCVAGARPGTVITKAVYDDEKNGRTVTEEEKNLYRVFFAGLHSMSNGYRCKKIEADLKAHDMPTSCLVYSQVPEHRSENSCITEYEPNKCQTTEMDQPTQHNVPPNFSQHMREMLENTLSRFLGTPPRYETTTSQFSGCGILPPNYHNCDRYHRSNKRKKRRATYDDDEHSYSDSEEDDRKHSRKRQSRQRVDAPTPPHQNTVLQKELDYVKDQLHMLVDNIPPKNSTEVPTPHQQPNLADQLGEVFDKKLKDAICHVHHHQQQQQPSSEHLGEFFDKRIKEVIAHMQQEQQSSLNVEQQSEETAQIKKVGQTTDNYTTTKPTKNLQEHVQAKLNESYIFGQ